MSNEAVYELRLKQLEDEITRLKVELKELKQENKEEINLINRQIKLIEERYSKLEGLNIELKQDMKFYSTKIENVEAVLKEIATEIKGISSRIVEFDTLHKVNEKPTGETETGKFMNKLLDSNNRVLFYVIITLCSVVLISMGAKLSDITKILVP